MNTQSLSREPIAADLSRWQWRGQGNTPETALLAPTSPLSACNRLLLGWSVQAVYTDPAGNYLSSSSTTFMQQVNPDATTTTTVNLLKSSVNAGSPVTFTASGALRMHLANSFLASGTIGK